MKRSYPERPYVGVGVVVLRGDEVLLIQRGKPPKAGDWSIPGGAQHLGETVAEAALREVREETGLEVRLGEHLAVVDSIQRDAAGVVAFHYTLVDFAAYWVAGRAGGGRRRGRRVLGENRRARPLRPLGRDGEDHPPRRRRRARLERFHLVWNAPGRKAARQSSGAPAQARTTWSAAASDKEC